MVGIVATLVIYLVGMHLQMNQSLKKELSSDIDCLLILGSSLRSEHMTPTLRSRLEKGAELLKKYPKLMKKTHFCRWHHRMIVEISGGRDFNGGNCGNASDLFSRHAPSNESIIKERVIIRH